LQEPTHQDTYVVTLPADTFRILMTITAEFDLEVRQYDAVNAFANSVLDEVVYCKYPEGFEQAGMCLLLQRALYGLRQSPLLWLKNFSKTLQELGLMEVPGEPCLYSNDWLVVLCYVDDIVALCRTNDLPRLRVFENALMEHYEMREMGQISWFLGIRIIRGHNLKCIWLCQDSYIGKITAKFNLKYHKPAHIPLSTEELIPYKGKAIAQDIYAYQ
jgi:hypothetical protein